MSLKKGLSKLMNGWVSNMKKITPVGKRPRPASAKKMYPKPLKESIKYIQKAKPIIQMNLYGMYVNSGHRTRGTSKVPPNPFINKSFDTTFDQMEDELPDAVFDLFNKEFKLVFDKYKKIG